MTQFEPPPPKAQRLLEVIAKQISNGRIRAGQPETFLAYSEALELLGETQPWPHSGSKLSNLGLKDLHLWLEDYDELPKVTGLIVDKENRRPHQDFATWHGHEKDLAWETWWLNEAKKAIEYDWSPYLPPISEANLTVDRSRLREDDEVYGDSGAIVADPPPARIRRSGITVAEVLQWLAEGESESDILRQHSDLQREDIRASLIFAADRERQAARHGGSRFTERWTGKFTLPQADPTDPRLNYLLERYERSGQ